MGLLIKDDFKGPRVDFFFFLVGLKMSMFIGFTELNRYKTDGGTDAFINTSSMSRDFRGSRVDHNRVSFAPTS